MATQIVFQQPAGHLFSKAFCGSYTSATKFVCREACVAKFLVLLKSEFQKKAWNSVLQLGMGGVAIYLISITIGPLHGCGPGNAQVMENVFNCIRGEMAPASKLLITGGIVLACLCWARAALLYERSRAV